MANRVSSGKKSSPLTTFLCLPKRIRQSAVAIRDDWRLPGVVYREVGMVLFGEDWNESPMCQLICDAQESWGASDCAHERRKIRRWTYSNILAHLLKVTTLEAAKHWFYSNIVHWFR